jgi:hypothetical protein
MPNATAVAMPTWRKGGAFRQECPHGMQWELEKGEATGLHGIGEVVRESCWLSMAPMCDGPGIGWGTWPGTTDITREDQAK